MFFLTSNFLFTNYNCIQYLTMTQSKLSLSNLKSANLNLVCNQMQFRNRRLWDSLSVLWRGDCVSHTLEKDEEWKMKVCTWLLQELFHSDNQTYFRSFQQQIYEILSTPLPFSHSRKWSKVPCSTFTILLLYCLFFSISFFLKIFSDVKWHWDSDFVLVILTSKKAFCPSHQIL